MAILSSTNISHPAIEALFTIDEETGMTGAMGLEGGILKGEILNYQNFLKFNKFFQYLILTSKKLLHFNYQNSEIHLYEFFSKQRG